MNKSQTISVIAITIFAAILLVGPVADDANAHNKKHKALKARMKRIIKKRVQKTKEKATKTTRQVKKHHKLSLASSIHNVFQVA